MARDIAVQCFVCSMTGADMDIGKDLIAASSTPIVLAILAEADSYGYAILQRVRDVSGGRMEWTDGMLYPVLHRLERLGQIEAHWEVAQSGRRRKYYRITASGQAQLVEQRRQWEAVDATLRGIWHTLSLASDAQSHKQLQPQGA
jgi:PadR family transcriptional regulator PadR